MIRMDAVILAAGAGKRMKMPSTPKALIPVNGKPLICYAIDALRDFGIRNIFVVKYYADNFSTVDAIYKNTDVRLNYIDDFERKGSLYSFSLSQSKVADVFVCLDCDLIITPDSFSKMLFGGIKKYRDQAYDGLMAIVKNPSKLDTDMLLTEDGLVKRFIKGGSSLCKRGGYVFLWNKKIFENINDFTQKGCFSLSEYYDYFVQCHRIGTMEIEDIWDVDNKNDLLFSNSYLGKVNS